MNSRKLRALGLLKYRVDDKTNVHNVDERMLGKIPF